MGRARTLANTVKVSDALTIPSGNTAARPASAVAGTTRFNSQTGSIEFFDGANWISTNLIPTVDSVTGTIYAGAASNLTITVTNGTDTVTVRFSEGGSTVADVADVTLTSGSATVAVPAAVYGQTAGDTIAVSVINQDGTPSSNAINKTVQGLPTGGTITTSGGYRIHTFTSSSSFVVPSGLSLSNVEYLVVAGGGSGGSRWHAAGGGAGGYRSSVTGESSGGGASAESKLTLSANTYTVTVGAGGAAVNGDNVNGNPGSSSVFGSITSTGGGFGATYPNVGGSGGSGGGGGGSPSGAKAGGSGTSGQGFAGGAGDNEGGNGNGGGGGGAGAVGQAANGSNGGNGGNGVSSAITGSSVPRAGGGGGVGIYNGGSNGSGGSGGGGAAADPGVAGSANTGGGGGGAASSSNSVFSGAGGSGIVIVRYQL